MRDFFELCGTLAMIVGFLMCVCLMIAIVYGGPVILIMAAAKWLFF